MSDLRPRFEPVSRRMVSEEVRDALAGSIQDGRLVPGSLLPSERALCEEFGVARTSVREAVQSLVAIGRLCKRGNRFYVTERLPEITVSAADSRKNRVRELFEVRQIIEVAVAALAARRAGERERAELLEIADGFTADMELVAFREADRLFHWSVARSAGNAALLEVYGKVLDAVFASEEFRGLLDAVDNAPAVRDVIADAGSAHRTIAEAIAARDDKAAAAAAEHHLAHVEHAMTDRMF